MSWKEQDPKTWDAVTAGYGEGWWDKTVEEINVIEDQRVNDGSCVFCGKVLADDEDCVLPLPPRPWAGPFCSAECANHHLHFYCWRKGK